jgi:hypothetical protein
MSNLFRVIIAITAFALAAVHLTLPNLRIDVTFFVLIAVALLVTFAPNIRIKALDVMGVKVEFDKQEPQPEAVPSANVIPGTPRGPARQATLGGDNYATRIAKLTPVETLAPYVIVTSLLANVSDTHSAFAPYINWIIFVLFLVLTPIYFLKILPYEAAPPVVPDRGPIIIPQTTISTITFAAWAFALGGPFRSLSWYNSAYGALALTIIVFLVPVIYAPAVADE